MANIASLLEDKLILNELWESSIDEETGEVKECEALETLTKEVEQDLITKTGRVIQYFMSLDSQTEALDKEIKRLQARKKLIEKRNNNFKNFLKFTLERLGVKKIETTLGVLSIKNNPASVVILDESKIPQEYKTTKYIDEISKTQISKDLKAGIEVPGAALKQTTSLNIK